MAFYCPECRTKIEPPSSERQTKVSCSSCGNVFPIPDEYRKGVLRPGTRIGGYEVVRLIGTGGMGKVYEAQQLSLKRPVALKVLSPKVAGSDAMIKRFLLEVRATASLEHVNIVTVYEADQQEGLLFLAMELIDGQSVDKILNESKEAIDEAEALRYARKVAEAMEYAWRHQRLLHRDIKPANIIITGSGEIKLCDLGIAKRPDDEFDITQEGMAIGTPHYMSPEQGQGLLDIDFRSDIYSLGASLFHMATGTLPFDDDSAVAVITKQIVEEMPEPRERNPKLSAPCAQLIRLMMEKKPSKRFPSWEALISDIDRVLEEKYPAFRPRPQERVSDTSIKTDTEEESSTDENEVVTLSTSELRASKRTVVDMGSMTQGLRRAKMDERRNKKGWSLVRSAALFIVLLALFAFLAFEYRYELMPELFKEERQHIQPLKINDGVHPAPKESSQSKLDQDKAWIDTALADSPKTEELKEIGRLEALVAEVSRRGIDPVSVAYQWRQRGKDELAGMLYSHCLDQAGSVDWAAAAVRDQSAYYRSIGDSAKLEAILRRGLALPLAAVGAHMELADLLVERKQAAKAIDMLGGGVKRYAKHPEVADILAIRLLHEVKRGGQDAQLWKWTSFVIANLPRTAQATGMATALSRRMPKIPQVRLPVTEKDAAVLYEMRPLLNEIVTATSATAKARALLKVGQFYDDRGMSEKALAVWESVAEQSGRLSQGEIGGRAFLQMAKVFKKQKSMVEYVAALEAIIYDKYHGPDGVCGVEAARELAGYYGTKGEALKEAKVLQMAILAFPGKQGGYAGAQLLQMANEDLKQGELLRAVRQLMAVVRLYPGPGQVHKKKARAILDRLTDKEPAEMGRAAVQRMQYGPFVDIVPFSPQTTRYIEPKNNIAALETDQAVTVECWVLQRKSSNGLQLILSRHDGMERGFNLGLQGWKLVFQFSDGKRSGQLTTPKLDFSWWRHVAVVMNDNGVRVYLDGKLQADNPRARVENRGASRLRVGCFSKGEFKLFQGAIQHLIVYPGARYKKAFRPLPMVRGIDRAALCISALRTGPSDLCGQELIKK